MFFVYAANSNSLGYVKAENSQSFDIGLALKPCFRLKKMFCSHPRGPDWGCCGRAKIRKEGFEKAK